MRKSTTIAYTPALDGLRAICILFTLGNHVDGMPKFVHGTVGVDVFFALSGFLITMMIHDIRREDIIPYLTRRAFRIAPVYYLAFAGTALLTILSARFHVGPSKIGQLIEITVPSLVFSRELAESPTLFGHAWTIGIEEKFYLGWPIMLLLVRPTAFRIAAALAVAGIVALCVDDSQIVRGYAGIAFGTIAAFFYRSSRFSIAPNLAAAMVIVAYLIVHLSASPYANLGMSLSAAFLVPALYGRESSVKNLLGHRWLAHLGRLTFSVYMFHVLILFAVKLALRSVGVPYWYLTFALGYVLSVGFAQLVYLLYEKPFIELGRKLATRLPPRVATSPKPERPSH